MVIVEDPKHGEQLISTTCTEIRQLVQQAEQAAEAAHDWMDKAVWNAWQIGEGLAKLKANVKHGEFGLVRDGLCPEGKSVKQWRKQACEYMRVYASNPTAQCVDHLSNDSLRQYRLSFVPPKERPEIEGDFRIKTTGGTALQLANKWAEFRQRISNGLDQTTEADLRRDLKPLYADLWQLYGGKAP